MSVAARARHASRAGPAPGPASTCSLVTEPERAPAASTSGRHRHGTSQARATRIRSPAAARALRTARVLSGGMYGRSSASPGPLGDQGSVLTCCGSPSCAPRPRGTGTPEPEYGNEASPIPYRPDLERRRNHRDPGRAAEVVDAPVTGRPGHPGAHRQRRLTLAHARTPRLAGSPARPHSLPHRGAPAVPPCCSSPRTAGRPVRPR